jgi:hypothetical protein
VRTLVVGFITGEHYIGHHDGGGGWDMWHFSWENVLEVHVRWYSKNVSRLRWKSNIKVDVRENS